MRRLTLAVCLTLTLVSPGGRPLSAQAATPPVSGVELASLDRATDPCVDFYQFACGGWVASHPLQPDQRSFGRVMELQERNFDLLRRILHTRGTGDRAKASDYYTACTDERTIEAKGLAPLSAELARIAALTRAGVPALTAHMQYIATIPSGPATTLSAPLFSFGSGPNRTDATQTEAQAAANGIILPDRDMYLKTDERSAALRNQYRDHIQQMLALLGGLPAEAAASARAVLTIETTLAGASLDAVSRRNPKNVFHPMPVASLQALMPAFDWTAFLAAMAVPKFETIDVLQPEYLKAVNTLVAEAPIADLQAYFRWHMLHASVVMLPAAFRQADFEFFGRALRGQKAPPPRWRECVAETDAPLGEAVGKAFVEETFSPRAKSDALAMASGIQQAMARDINEAAWMSAATKQAALVKLQALANRIGYPDAWHDYSALRIAKDDALGNYHRALTFEQQRDFRHIGGPVDRGEWSMTPATANAYYSQLGNNVNFPAGMLQLPFYLAGRDSAVNYGGAGTMIGHEVTHGFDDNGRRFDAQGNLRDWWTEADANAYAERATCIADQYSSYQVLDEVHINGRLTLGENTADNGGLRLALMAYLAGPGATPQPAIDGFSPEQRYFLGFAQLWCENARPEAERLKAAANPHSSNRYRVNGAASNMREFQGAFSCKADAPMVRSNACRVW